MTEKLINIGNIPAKLYGTDSPRGAVIAVHGFGGSKESGAIEGLAKRVCPHGLCVIAFDLPAHGERNDAIDALDPHNVIKEIMTIERFAAETIGGELYAFATSFGGMNMLHRLAMGQASYKRVVLRVPAVNMANTVVTISAVCDSAFSMEKAEKDGFHIKLSKEFVLPFQFYERLKGASCLRSDEAWNDSRILTIYAENDELVSPADTQEFLRLNPDMRSVCAKGSPHHILEPRLLSQVLDSAAEFILG